MYEIKELDYEKLELKIVSLRKELKKTNDQLNQSMKFEEKKH